MAGEDKAAISAKLKRSREQFDSFSDIENWREDGAKAILLPDSVKKPRNTSQDYLCANLSEAPEPEADLVSKLDDLNSQRGLADNSIDTERHVNIQDTADCDNDDDGDESDISDLSGHSDAAWRGISGPIAWVQRQMSSGQNPRSILQAFLGEQASNIPPDFDNIDLWKLVIELLTEPPRRKKLTHVNTIDDVVGLLKSSKNIMVLTGAGVSVSCGIPDFRSRDGVYARLSVDFPDLPDPQAMFDMRYFRQDPRPFFKFAKEIYPGQFQPSRSHHFIKVLEEHGKLLRNYTQNIDTLEQVAGIRNVIQCHGSFASATCMTCKYKVSVDYVREDIVNQVIPKCPECTSDAEMPVLKPDIVFFGESLPEEFHSQMADDKDHCDLLIVIGSSLKVRPVALIPNSLPNHIPQILINREPLKHLNFDVELLGDCDGIIAQICDLLGDGWNQLSVNSLPLREVTEDDVLTPPPTPPTSETSRMSYCTQSEESRMSFTQLSDSAASNMSTQPYQNSLNGTLVSNNSEINTMHTGTESGNRVADTNGTSIDGNVTSGASNKTVNGNSNRNSSNADSVQCSTSAGKCESLDGDETYLPNSQFSEERSVGGSIPTQPTVGGSMPTQPTVGGSMPTIDRPIDEAELLRIYCKTREKQSIAKRLPSNSYLFLAPNRYVFPGAEVYQSESEDSDSSGPCSEPRSEPTSDQALRGSQLRSSLESVDSQSRSSLDRNDSEDSAILPDGYVSPDTDSSSSAPLRNHRKNVHVVGERNTDVLDMT